MSLGFRLENADRTPATLLSDVGVRRSFARRLARQVIPKQVRHKLGNWLGYWQARCSPARSYQNRVILPRIALRGGSVLLIGCRRYTARDPKFMQRHGVVCWTLDIDPEVTRWGAAGGRHVTAPIEQAASYFRAATFDTVVLSGVFGFGVDEVAAQEAAVDACSGILKPDGLLVLGWNTDLVADPSALTSIARNFRSSSDAELVERISFHRCTHVFDFYTRRSQAGVLAALGACRAGEVGETMIPSRRHG